VEVKDEDRDIEVPMSPEVLFPKHRVHEDQVGEVDGTQGSNVPGEEDSQGDQTANKLQSFQNGLP
jgi:hypothetical protein